MKYGNPKTSKKAKPAKKPAKARKSGQETPAVGQRKLYRMTGKA